MKDAIVEKLQAVLDRGVDDECKVLYVLAESRKLLDKFPPPEPVPFALRLYCNWALHVDLNLDTRSTREFLERVDQFVGSVKGSQEDADIILENKIFRDFVYFDSFRTGLKAFLLSYDLPTSLCDDEARWQEFAKHYAGIIQDGSISCKNPRLPLKMVREVIFTKGRARDEALLPFDLVWKINMLDGSSLSVELHATPVTGGKMIFHGLHFEAAPAKAG